MGYDIYIYIQRENMMVSKIITRWYICLCVCVRVCHCIYIYINYEYIVLCTVYHSISTCTCVNSDTYYPLGVQGEVYQADLPGKGLVAVKISRRNDDYAKGSMAIRGAGLCSELA